MELDDIKLTDEEIRQYDLIDKYLFNKMTEKEVKDFFEELKNNPEFKRRAISTAYMVKAIKSTR